ncbi:MAG: hypothetical protein ABI401_09300 [Candidatus Dormibacter sp.]
MPDHGPTHSSDELAEGEDPSTASVQEAERWVLVYTELVHLEDNVIKSVKARMSRMSPAARRETERTDLPALEKDDARFHDRLAFWRERRDQLKKTK